MDRWIGGWTLWDSAMYAEIAQFGYGDPETEWTIIRGFFPLYPWAMRLFVAITPLPETLEGYGKAGPWVSLIFFVAAVIVFALLVERLFGPAIARTASLLLCISPMAFFFSAGYSESIFLFFVVLTFYFAQQQRWYLVAIVVMLAGLTRVTGLFLAPAILLLAWERKASLKQLAIMCAVMPLGVFSLFSYFWWKYDNFFLYFDTQNHFWAGWHHKVGQFIDVMFSDPGLFISDLERFKALLNLGIALLWVVSLYWVWKKIDHGIALFTTIIVVFHVSYSWHSLARYMLPAIGFYIVAAMLLERPGWNTWFRQSVVVVSCIVLTTLTILHTHAIGIV